MITIDETLGGVTFAVKLQPRARRNAIVGELGDMLKLSLTAPPVGGRANLACVEFLSRALEVSKSSVLIISGETSRRKLIHVRGITAAQLRERLQL